MALAERAELVARLSLKDDFSGKLRGIESKMSGLGKAAGRAGKAISIGLGAGLAVGAGVTVKAVRSGLDSLAELESATTSVDAAIKQMGLTGQVTSGQIAAWANEIEASVGAAFDDKAITQAATSLIRYGRVTTANLRPALVVMTDLAAKTGSVEGASELLAKALAAPEKAAARLVRQGIILTEVEQEQIKALVAAGKAGEAQAAVLKAVERATKGAAAASQGPYARSIATLQDAWEDATRALAVGFLPVLEEVRDILSKELAKPGTLDRIKDFGKGLAGGLKGLIDAAKNVPWDQVGDAMKIAGAGAKAVYDAFTGLPPWVQTAVLTGWGLNKLSGGLLSGVVGELGKGLVKGVLGMNAGVVNARAGVVNVAGGVGGGGTGAVPVGATKTGIGTLGKVFLIGEAIGLVAAVVAVGQSVRDAGVAQAQGISETLNESLAGPQTAAQLQTKLDAINTGIARLKADPIAAALITGPVIAELEQQRQAVLAAQSNAALTAQRLGERIDLSRQATTSSLDRTRANAEANRIAIVSAQRTGTSAITSATRTGDAAVVAAIRGIQRPIISVSVTGNVIRTTYQGGATLTRSIRPGILALT